MSGEVTEVGDRLNEALSADHAALEAILTRFCVELDSDRIDAARVTWRMIELDLGAHLKAEERFILPTFERAYPHHGAMIRRQHDELRRALESVAVALSRGRPEAASVDELLEAVRRDARHEEVVFYYWAKLHLDDENAESVIEHLRASSSRSHGVSQQGG